MPIETIIRSTGHHQGNYFGQSNGFISNSIESNHPIFVTNQSGYSNVNQFEVS